MGGAGCSRSHELQRAFPIGTAAESALSSNTRSVGHVHMNFSAFPMGTAANSAWSSGFLAVLGLCSHEPQCAFPIDTLVDKTKTHLRHIAPLERTGSLSPRPLKRTRSSAVSAPWHWRRQFQRSPCPPCFAPEPAQSKRSSAGIPVPRFPA